MYVPFYVYTFICMHLSMSTDTAMYSAAPAVIMFAGSRPTSRSVLHCIDWLFVEIGLRVWCAQSFVTEQAGRSKHLHVGLPSTILLFGYRGLYSCSVVLFWSTDLGRATVELVAARRLDGIIDTRAPLQLLGTVNGVAVLVPNKRTNRHEDIPGPPQQHKKTDTKR